MFIRYLVIICLVISTASLHAADFSVDSYKQFLLENQDMELEKMYSMYPPGMFTKKAPVQDNIKFYNEVKEKYKLTNDEITLLEKHGFLVTERLSFSDMWRALEDVYNKDLPVFINTDMILHALHKSYDAILKDVEKALIIKMLDNALLEMHDELENYKMLGAPAYLTENINDADVYITVARNLLSEKQIESKFGNGIEIDSILKMIKKEKPVNYKLFTSTAKLIDFSQFTPRGHYTQDEELERYFRTMMWLGRIQFYLTAPKSADNPQIDSDIQRQIIDAVLLTKLISDTDAKDKLEKIDEIIKAFVGESDNVKIEHINELLAEIGVNDPAAFNDYENVKKFQKALENKSYAGQKILSQILMSDPMSPDQIEPSSSFLLMGQRFVIDSYVTGSVVYDKIIYKGEKVLRLKPSAMDVLFTLGNNAAGDLLKPELEKYPYMPNLSALRYLIDGYDHTFWQQSFYNGWLNSIRKLNVPDEAEKGKLPDFMKTAAWWQSRMNTQLASWAQLRHDNLLYAKQSYTGGLGCFYPTAYLEPEPDLYREIAELGERSQKFITEVINNADIDNDHKYLASKIKYYFSVLAETCQKLEEIANAELKGNITKEQIEFLKKAYSMANSGCVKEPNGWFSTLFYVSNDDVRDMDYVVADVHTTPTDAAGNMVGWVWHVGTGNINMMFVVAEDIDGKPTVFCGPAMSFHETTSLNFKRYTDGEWESNFVGDKDLESTITRPSFTELYLADVNGENKYTNPPILPTSVDSPPSVNPEFSIRTFAKPNPFTESVVIGFKIPEAMTGEKVIVTIHDRTGREVVKLYDNILSSGSYSLRWDGRTAAGEEVSNGMYIYRFETPRGNYSGKVVLQR